MGVAGLNSLATSIYQEKAEKCTNTPIYYNSIAVELYRAIKLKEGTQIITIPSTNSINLFETVELVKNNFYENGTIFDISAYKNKKSSKFHTFGMKFLFKKIIDSFEIPAFLEFDKFVLALTYRGCKPVCIFCKHIKQPKEINLELSDQPIYADSSCPSTPNFKKEWGNDHRNYTENNVSTSVIDTDFVNELADTISFTDAEMQHDKHYNHALESLINDILEWLNCKLGAHCRKEIIKKIRKSSKNKKLTKKNSNSNFKVMTFNVQSIYNKVEDLELILNKTNSAVLYLQETHLLEKTSLLRLKEYTCIESKKKFKKNRLRTADCINSKTSPRKKYKIISINIHTPHVTVEKNKTKKQIELYLQNIISKNENKKIILAGDFNMDTKSTINWINRIGIRLTRMSGFNSKGSRLKGLKISRIIDHICSLISEKKESLAVWAKNFRQLAQMTSIGSSSFDLFPLNKIDVFSECNITPTWNDITTALKTTPNNKAAGIDSIPSKLWKLVQDETEPKSHLAILINKIVNKAWNECNLIGTNIPAWWYHFLKTVIAKTQTIAEKSL
ncbi:hypothetical protein BB561_005181 [Smittium simulii]|uniref:Endonuclease/exonuclease/phosphatase domain-containing protein n=1 Tax=Smittium simulii TaxID=133385 RepID=A0A2T9YBQ8_9FUNG|nr:hypothetical protein BB561_005181 [Smittium simulii]